MSQPVVEGSLGSPPFEKPNIEQVRLASRAAALSSSRTALGGPGACTLCGRWHRGAAVPFPSLPCGFQHPACAPGCANSGAFCFVVQTRAPALRSDPKSGQLERVGVPGVGRAEQCGDGQRWPTLLLLFLPFSPNLQVPGSGCPSPELSSAPVPVVFTPPPRCPSTTPFSLPQGVLNFVQYKFSHLPPKERQTMYELSKMFLLCLNYWKLETPSQFRQRSQNDDVATYKVNYTR